MPLISFPFGSSEGSWAVSGCVFTVGDEKGTGEWQGSSSGEFCVIAHRFWKFLGCRVYALLRAVLVKRGERTEIGNRVCGDGP